MIFIKIKFVPIEQCAECNVTMSLTH